MTNHFNRNIIKLHTTTHTCPESYVMDKETSVDVTTATVTEAMTKRCYSSITEINFNVQQKITNIHTKYLQ